MAVDPTIKRTPAPDVQPKPRAKKKTPLPGGTYNEIGATGLRQVGGYVIEEFLEQLRGPRAAKFYREMSENSPIVGALMLGYRQVAMHLPWEVQEPDDATAADKAATEFVKDAFEHMDETWESMLHAVLSELVFGWSLHEVVYKKRDDGKIGWAKFPIRGQETLLNWTFGPHGEILAMTQLDPVTGQTYTIPMGKALLFRTLSVKNNPEGRSMLRSAVVPYEYVRRIQEYEAIGVERDLAGLPIAWVPNEWFTSDDPQVKLALRQIVEMVADVRRNEREGLVLPMIYEDDLVGKMTHNKALDFQLMSSAGGRQFDTDKIITRYNQQIAMSLLGDFVTLGHDGVGSYSLGAVKMDLWVMVVDSICKGIAEVFNKEAIVKLLDLNGIDFDNPPELVYGTVSNVDLAALGTFIGQLSTAGILTPDEGTEAWLRDQAGMPPLDVGVEPIYNRAPINPLTGQPLPDDPLHDPADPANKFPVGTGPDDKNSGKQAKNPDKKVVDDGNADGKGKAPAKTDAKGK